MGNQQSQITTKKSLTQVIDYVATNYILTQNFQDMKKLADIDYCNNLVILTSDIIEKKLNNLEIQYLAQRLKEGVETNIMTKEKIIFLNKKNLENLDIKNKTQKRRICIGIAKFYVKVAHVFAAIVTTINPVYTYTDSSGNKQEINLLNKKNIPSDVKSKTKIKRMNLCSERLNALINNNEYNVGPDEELQVNPKFCNMNINPISGIGRSLISEPGIPELEKLYFDKYDYDNGGFIGMTDKMRKVYENDVETFYKYFTGNSSIPKNSNGKKIITKFSQIPLRDFHNSEGCKNNGVYTKAYKGTMKNKLFAEYAEHIKTMMKTTTSNQNKLLNIIDELFVFSLNPLTKQKEVVINPELDETKLQKIVEQTRKIIVNIYIRCEDDFLKGLELFEAIVEKQIKDTSQEQIKELEKTVEETIATETEQPSPEEPLTEEPTPEEPTTEEPTPEEPTPEEPTPEEPTPEEPSTEEPSPKEPSPEEPSPEEPSPEEPTTEEPTPAESSLSVLPEDISKNENQIKLKPKKTVENIEDTLENIEKKLKEEVGVNGDKSENILEKELEKLEKETQDITKEL